MKRQRLKTAVHVMMLAVLAVLSGCMPTASYSHYEPVPIEGWDKQQVLRFGYGPTDHENTYDVQLGVRATSLYPYTSITLVVRQERLPCHVVRTDTIAVPITSTDGLPMGQGVTLRHTSVGLPPITVGSNESLRITVAHHMHQTPLPGISDVGITLATSQYTLK